MNRTLYLVFENQITVSAVILLILSAKSFISNHTTANQRIFLWMFLAIKALLPFKYKIKVIVPAAEMVQTAVTVGKNPVHTDNNVFFFIWAIVSAVLFVLFIFLSMLYRQKLLRMSHPMNNPAVEQLRDDICKSIDVTRKIPVLYCYGIKSPLITGIFRPLIILPDKSTNALQLEWILRHELTHYKRHDILLKHFFITVALILWFNPLIWILCITAFRDMELACDSATVREENVQNRRKYCNMLLNAAACEPNLKTALFSSQLKGDAKLMKQRLSNILNPNSKKAGAIVLMILMLCVTAMTGIGAYAEKDASSPAKNVSSADTSSSANSTRDEKTDVTTIDLDSSNRVNVALSDGGGAQIATAEVNENGETTYITYTITNVNGEYIVEMSDNQKIENVNGEYIEVAGSKNTQPETEHK